MMGADDDERDSVGTVDLPHQYWLTEAEAELVEAHRAAPPEQDPDGRSTIACRTCEAALADSPGISADAVVVAFLRGIIDDDALAEPDLEVIVGRIERGEHRVCFERGDYDERLHEDRPEDVT